MKKNLVALMVTVVMVAGALVGCGSKEVQTVGGNGTTTEASAVETTTEYGTDNASVEEVAVEATTEETVEESAEAATEEISVEEVEKTAEEQLAEATVERTFRVYNYFCAESGRYEVIRTEGNDVQALTCGEEDGVNYDTFADYQFILNLITSDEAMVYYEKTEHASDFETWLDETVSTVVEYRDDLGCFTKTYYADEEQTSTIAVDFIFVEQ